MKLAIMQPYFLPYIGYFQAISAVDKYILYSNLNYIKDGWIHKNRILNINGTAFPITVLVANKSSFMKICDINLVSNKPWRKKILHSIYYNYKFSAFFDEIYTLVERVINYDTENLSTLNERCVVTVCQFLDISTEIVHDNSIYADIEEKLLKVDLNDYSEFPYLADRKPIKKVLRVIEICRRENAKIFINAIGGQALYNKNEFASYNINLNFIRTRDFIYPQKSNKFVPNLSIIDVLMNWGKEKTKSLLHEYDLI